MTDMEVVGMAMKSKPDKVALGLHNVWETAGETCGGTEFQETIRDSVFLMIHRIADAAAELRGEEDVGTPH